MKVAALDLGTNTFLCLILQKELATGRLSILEDIAETVRLGQGVQSTGTLQAEALQRAETALIKFKNFMEYHRVDKVLALATSAARDAKNKDAFFEILKNLNIPLQIISGEQEAHYTFHGAFFSLPVDLVRPEEENLVIDVGGGSTELVLGRKKSILLAKSIDIGGVRITEKFISSQPILQQDWQKAEAFIQDICKDFIQKLSAHSIKKIIAVAGTPTSLAALSLGGFSEEKVHGHILTLSQLKSWLKIFADTSIEQKQNLYHLGGRADIIFAGTLILKNILELLHFNELVVSTKGVRYGLATELLQQQ